MAWINRFWNLLRRNSLDAGLREELQFHLDSRVRDNMRSGMSEPEARQDAVRRFGNQALAKELARDADLLPSVESFGRDVAYALRSLRNSPGFTAVALLVLALGIGANSAVFTVVNGVILRPLPFQAPDQLFLISCQPKRNPFFIGTGMTDRHYLDWHNRDQHFESTATYSGSPVALTREGEPAVLYRTEVTPDFLRVLGANPAIGRGFSPQEGKAGTPPVVILSDKVWQDRFHGDRGVLGRVISLDGTGYTVIGVMPPGFAFPSSAEMWTPFEVRTQPGNFTMRPVIGRLKTSVSREQAQAALASFADEETRIAPDGPGNLEAKLRPLKEFVLGDSDKPLLIFWGAVALVLVIACANVSNLLLIRSASRRHEIAVRAALGASRGRLIRQLLTESVLIALAGGIAGIFLAAAGVRALLVFAPSGKIPRVDEVHLDGWMLVFTIGVSALTGIVFGLLPAFRATRRELRESMSESGRTSTGRNETLRNALAVSEIALALVLLTGAGLLLKSFWRILSIDPGFRSEQTIAATVDLPDTRYQSTEQIKAFHHTVLARLSAAPAVDAVGTVNWLPLGNGLIRGDFQLEGGRTLPSGFIVDKPVVSPGYFRAMGIRVLRGRAFTDRDGPEAPGVVVVSQSVARTIWPDVDALGQRISMQDHPTSSDWLTVIGIVDDVRQESLTAKPSSAIYQTYAQVKFPFFLRHMAFVAHARSNTRAVAPVIRDAIHEADPDQPLQSLMTLEDFVAKRTADPRFRAQVLVVFAALALLLSAIGIYGVLACAVAERRHEIGIRMALGATGRNITRMVLGRSALLALAGVVIGSLGAVAITRVLENFLFEVKATDPLTFGLVAFCIALVALGAGLLPARRASAVDPAAALRCE